LHKTFPGSLCFQTTFADWLGSGSGLRQRCCYDEKTGGFLLLSFPHHGHVTDSVGFYVIEMRAITRLQFFLSKLGYKEVSLHAVNNN